MADLCDDNRFELIEKYKKKLIDETNIESAPDEMKVLNDILFRLWQMGWLDKLEQQTTQPKTEERTVESAQNVSNDDLVSKKAAIEAVNEWFRLYAINRTMSNVTSIQDILRQLPSAQPDFYDYSDIEPLWESFAKEHDVNLTDGAKQLKDAMWAGYRKGKADAQPEQRWIPCSETEDLPEHEVLCCDKYGEELIGWLSYEDDQWICESDGEMMYDPIAWMEKPEPWKGEEE